MTETPSADNATTRASLLDRTMTNLREVWRDMADWRGGFANSPAPSLPDKDIEALKTQMRDCLDARGGEVSARARAGASGVGAMRQRALVWNRTTRRTPPAGRA